MSLTDKSIREDDEESIFEDKETSNQKILEEDDYIDRMSKIIRRDFFPGAESFPNASEDPHNSQRSESSTKRASGYSALDSVRSTFSSTSSVRSRKESCSLSLNDFLEKYTSEDNAYFEKMQKKEQIRHRMKYPWLYRTRDRNSEIESAHNLKLPFTQQSISIRSDDNIDRMINLVDISKNPLINRNDSLIHRDNDRVTINYSSNRLGNDPIFKEPLPHINEKPRTFNRFKDKIGVDGKLLDGSATPEINGYTFIPAPETPKQTLLESPRMNSESNKFFILDESPRDKLAHRLYEDKVAKSIRTPKIGSNLTPSRRTPSTKMRSIDFDFSPSRIKTPILKHNK